MNKWNREKKPFLVLYLFLVVLNAPLIFLRLTNQYDGLWNQDDYMAGAWELSNGRWFWPYLDHARFGISLDPLPNLLAAAGFVGMVLLLARAMRLSWNKRTYLASMLFLASTGITCQLSFSCNLRRASATDALTSGRLADQNGRPPDNPNSVLQLDH
ncbi:hypothetical protein ACTNE4_12485, partial [Bacillota bacterium HCP3S3_F3_2]